MPLDSPPKLNNSSPDIQMPTDPTAVGGAPAASGMMVPQAPEGDIESARLDWYLAMRLLDRGVGKIGRKSDEADVAMRARAILTKVVGRHEEESEKFSDADIKRMLLTLAGPSAPQAPQSPQGSPGGGGQPGGPGAGAAQQPGQQAGGMQ
jgi:hypothetical protein